MQDLLLDQGHGFAPPVQVEPRFWI
jgi:hypothetical protein